MKIENLKPSTLNKKSRLFTVRGYNQGKNARPGRCHQCGCVIDIGEQYYYDKDSQVSLCLGCYTTNDHFNGDRDTVYIPSTDSMKPFIE